jgi:hypothetical protein
MALKFKTSAVTSAVSLLAFIGLGIGCGGGGGSTEATAAPAEPGVFDKALAFDKTKYTTINVTLDGVSTPVRWYREVCYVGKPMKLAPTQALLGPPINVDNQDCGFQNMNIYVREADAAKQDNAIFLNVSNGGWYGTYQGGLNGWNGTSAVLNGTNYRGADIINGSSYVSTNETDKVGAALARGFVYVTIASRSRKSTAPAGAFADGPYQGKAPAAIVDAKAAVLYLRLNDNAMPGNANRIIVNGTSGGGAQVTQLGATGDHADYLPYLKAIGAAGVDANGKSGISDGVFAVVAYCPIQDIGNADISYEWMYNVLGTRAAVSADQKAGLIVDASGAELVRASNPDPSGSAALLGKFAAYQAGLALKNDAGINLTADNILAALQDEFKKSASNHVKAGKTIVAFGAPGTAAANGVVGGTGTLSYVNDFINVDATGNVTFFSMANYLKFVAKQSRLKAMPSFDQVGQTPALAATASADSTKGTGAIPSATIFGNYSGGESNLFGTPAQVYTNFTEYGWNNNNGGDPINSIQSDVGLKNTGLTWAANPQQAFVLNQAKLINALPYIGKTDGITPHWRIRNGARDRDTSFTIAYNMSRALKADPKVKTIDFALQWDTGHAGNYDVQSAFQWIDQRLAGN